MDNPLRMASVLRFPEFAGPHNQILRLTGPLSAKGVESLAFRQEGQGADRLRAGAVPVEVINLGCVRAVKDLRVQARMIARFPKDMWQLLRLFRHEKPDVVILSGWMNPHTAIAARLLGVPIIWQLLDTRASIVLRKIMVRVNRALADSLMPIGHSVGKLHPGAQSSGSPRSESTGEGGT